MDALEKRIQRLEEAAKEKKAISIVYLGGSRPGEERKIVPKKIALEEIQAVDPENHIAKTFKIEKIRFPDESYTVEKRAIQDNLDNKTIEEAFSDKLTEIENLGWHVKLSKNKINLHSYFGNGKVRKGADVRLEKYEDNINRPFYLASKSTVNARTYGKLQKAAEVFMQEAKKYAPNKKED